MELDGVAGKENPTQPSAGHRYFAIVRALTSGPCKAFLRKSSPSFTLLAKRWNSVRLALIFFDSLPTGFVGLVIWHAIPPSTIVKLASLRMCRLDEPMPNESGWLVCHKHVSPSGSLKT